eukprot:43414-Eustigmatos_ZCMA.PRE.1
MTWTGERGVHARRGGVDGLSGWCRGSVGMVIRPCRATQMRGHTYDMHTNTWTHATAANTYA